MHKLVGMAFAIKPNALRSMKIHTIKTNNLHTLLWKYKDSTWNFVEVKESYPRKFFLGQQREIKPHV
jgi:hypothetical protein